MCGRYTLTSPLEGVQQLFEFTERPNLEPRSNIAPTQEVPALRLGSDGRRHMVLLRWGLIPSWAKDAKIASRLINARAETVAEKPSFRRAFAARRCLMPADGYYEWETTKAGKQPYRVVRKDHEVFAFAGLWESWRDPESNKTVETCCLLTTAANEQLAAIHHRMPVILQPERIQTWMDPGSSPDVLASLLHPFPQNILTFYPVSYLVNKVANQDLSLIEPLSLSDQAQARQGQLF